MLILWVAEHEARFCILDVQIMCITTVLFLWIYAISFELTNYGRASAHFIEMLLELSRWDLT